MRDIMESPWLSTKEAARYLRIGVITLLQLRKEGVIAAHMVDGRTNGGKGSMLRWRQSDLDKVFVRPRSYQKKDFQKIPLTDSKS